MDRIPKNNSKYKWEIGLMKDMMKAGAPGFPRLLYYEYDKQHFYIVMESLGKNLRELRELNKRKNFSVKTVAMIGL